MTLNRIREWYEYWNGDVYVSFSGGKDSTVLLHLVRSLYPEVPAVFADTGLEYPEIKEFVKTIDNVIVIRPKMSFREAVELHGYPIISKEIAFTIDYARKGSQWAIDRLNGNHDYGNHKKYKWLLEAPFKISDKCCNSLKKEPFKVFEKNTNLKPIVGTMADEGGQRVTGYLRTGCNAFDSDRPISKPISFWKEEDIWQYIRMKNIDYSSIYDKGYQRTGCMFCMFGVGLNKGPNKFQLMAQTHPQIYDYCINKLGLKSVLEYLHIPYEIYEDGKYIGEMQKFEDGKHEQLKLAL